MNKATAVYRDQSKLSQPLMNKLVDTTSMDEMDENASTTTTEQAVEQVKAALPLPDQQAQPSQKPLFKITLRHVDHSQMFDNSDEGP